MRRVGGRVRRRLVGPAETGIVAYVPEAGAVLAAAGAPPQAPGELAPHVTVLYPFVSSRRAHEAIDVLAPLLAAWPTVSWSLGGVGRFPGVVYLTVEPAAPFVALTRAVWGAFPDHPPYGGAFEEIVPHVTLGEHGEPPRLDEAVALLPVAVTTTSLALVRRDRHGWHHVVDLPLGTSTD